VELTLRFSKKIKIGGEKFGGWRNFFS